MAKIGKSNTDALYKLYMRAYGAKEEVRKDVVATVLQTSEGVCDNVKRKMPVRTGRAKAGWGKYTPEDLVMANPASNPGDGVWIISPQRMSIQQGTNVPYTEILNRGHSQQAPAGFIDLSFEMGREELHMRLKRLSILAAMLRKG